MCGRDHKKCYGTMFPSILPADADRIVSGKVFSFEIVRAGGMFASRRRVLADMQEWNDCLGCAEFRALLQALRGKLSLEAAIAG